MLEHDDLVEHIDRGFCEPTGELNRVIWRVRWLDAVTTCDYFGEDEDDARAFRGRFPEDAPAVLESAQLVLTWKFSDWARPEQPVMLWRPRSKGHYLNPSRPGYFMCNRPVEDDQGSWERVNFERSERVCAKCNDRTPAVEIDGKINESTYERKTA